jgi:hypothetical protein
VAHETWAGGRNKATEGSARLARYTRERAERRPPVVAGGLYNHPGHAELGQPIAEVEQRVVSHDADAGRPSCIRRRPRTGHPGAAHHLGPWPRPTCDPLDDLGLVGVDRIALASPVPMEATTRRRCKRTANLALVLEAHVTAHSAALGARLQTGPERPTRHDVDGRPRSIFSPGRPSPTGDTQDFRGTSEATRFCRRAPPKVSGLGKLLPPRFDSSLSRRGATVPTLARLHQC